MDWLIWERVGVQRERIFKDSPLPVENPTQAGFRDKQGVRQGALQQDSWDPNLNQNQEAEA